ncbi:ComEC/Rec2 family competence protein [Peribacillus deserti]|uniref:MBL fold metallo-hydrolase n=1 Tax=Peribacillus deserti TaxID=673318 RepID=A0A2N5M4K7_9BACI|nr:ComEC/Rec2 family competence protein [Peribacillus deserti]PLT29287.1 MBL fold metallo-hydrolase [Peribacillus deserti]
MKKINIVLVVILFISMLGGLSYSEAATNSLSVHVINVGQGDSIFIKAPTGETILVDAGKSGDTVVNYLKKQKVSTLTAVVSTHPDADHVGGLDEVLKAFTVKSVYAPKVSHTTQAFKNFLTAVKNEKLTIKTAQNGVVIPDKDKNTEIKFIAPVKTYAKSDLNNWSGVLMVKHGVKKILLTGDAELQSENDMMAKKLISKVDVLKVGHHGAKTSSSAKFLSIAKPTFSAISVGKNSYGHPTAETVKRLTAVKTKIYRTDKSGNIIFTSNGKTITVKTVK